MASREHSLDNLRQTGTVSDLAIAFQNIINTYTPRWNDSASIYFFSRKLKEAIRFEIAARGNVPTGFQAYIAEAVAVEHNLAAAIKGRPYHPHQQQHSQQQQQQQQQQFQQQQQQPQQQQQQQRALPPNRIPTLPYAAGAGPMDVDGSRSGRGPLTPEERRRRADNHLCAYCGQSGHLIATCPNATRFRQARGTFPGYGSSPLPGYYPPPGYQFPPFQGPFPGPWAVVPNPNDNTPTSALPKNDFPSQ